MSLLLAKKVTLIASNCNIIVKLNGYHITAWGVTTAKLLNWRQCFRVRSEDMDSIIVGRRLGQSFEAVEKAGLVSFGHQSDSTTDLTAAATFSRHAA